jgi:hypothetical protein
VRTWYSGPDEPEHIAALHTALGHAAQATSAYLATYLAAYGARDRRR